MSTNTVVLILGILWFCAPCYAISAWSEDRRQQRNIDHDARVPPGGWIPPGSGGDTRRG